MVRSCVVPCCFGAFWCSAIWLCVGWVGLGWVGLGYVAWLALRGLVELVRSNICNEYLSFVMTCLTFMTCIHTSCQSTSLNIQFA